MSRHIELTDEVYAAVEAAAAAAGVTPAELVDQLLTSVHSNGGVLADGAQDRAMATIIHAPSAADADAVSSARDSDLDGDEDAGPGTLYERMKHLIGIVSFGPPDISERHSEYFADGMVEKRREGRL